MLTRGSRWAWAQEGLHLVRIDERIIARVPAFGEVEAQIRNDWSYDQRRQANEAILERLLARYTVVIGSSTPGATLAATPGIGGRAEQ